METSEAKEVRIDVRTSETVKETVRKASELLGTTMSAFIVQQAYEAAQRALESQKSLVLSNRDRNRFLKLLEKPPKANKALIRLLERR